ncbi:hypothetical protein CPB84DRAFT_1744567 [Gymnopilus junonius]|uniref:Uncharacterized protein n=1 Tax=Gymnopilus junonius TaxID=109634 RepID=A0A9P5TQL1_GYMJU|nr:hypothetical protein CPB84DRAFT_1744567 [Gymnopilus junonius]
MRIELPLKLLAVAGTLSTVPSNPRPNPSFRKKKLRRSGKMEEGIQLQDLQALFFQLWAVLRVFGHVLHTMYPSLPFKFTYDPLSKVGWSIYTEFFSLVEYKGSIWWSADSEYTYIHIIADFSAVHSGNT